MFLSVWGGVFLSSILSLRYRMKFLYWGLVALLVYVAAFVAPENSRDAVAYLDYYRSIMSGEAVDVELSFRLISYLASFLFSSGIGVFFIYAFLSVPIKAFVIWKLSPYPFLSLLAYASYVFLLYDYTQIRAGLAASFIFLAFYFYVCCSRYKMLFAICVACFFHVSAVVFLVSVVLFFLGNYLLVSMGLLLLALVVLFINTLFPGGDIVTFLGALDFTGKTALYLSLQKEGVFSDISLLRRFSPVFYCLIPLFLHLVYVGRDRLILLYFQMLCLGVFVFSLFSSVPALAYRLSDYFFMFCCLSLASAWRVLGYRVLFVYIAIYSTGMMYYVYFYLGFAG